MQVNIVKQIQLTPEMVNNKQERSINLYMVCANAYIRKIPTKQYSTYTFSTDKYFLSVLYGAQILMVWKISGWYHI